MPAAIWRRLWVWYKSGQRTTHKMRFLERDRGTKLEQNNNNNNDDGNNNNNNRQPRRRDTNRLLMNGMKANGRADILSVASQSLQCQRERYARARVKMPPPVGSAGRLGPPGSSSCCAAPAPSRQCITGLQRTRDRAHTSCLPFLHCCPKLAGATPDKRAD